MKVSIPARPVFALAAILTAIPLSACSGGGSTAAPQTTVPVINPAAGGTTTTIDTIASSLKPASAIPVQATASIPDGTLTDPDDTATVAAVVDPAADGAAADASTLLGGHVLKTRTARTSARARSDVALNSPFDLTYFGGHVLGSAVQHNVFVNCTATCRDAEHRHPARLERDLNNDKFITLLLQYIVSPNVVDVTPITGRFPKGPGTDVSFTYDPVLTAQGFKNPVVTQREIVQILARAITQLNFPVGEKHIYHIFLDKNVDTCLGSANAICFSPDNPSRFAFCAYHNAVNFRGFGIVPFTVEPFGDVPGCATILPGPNAQPDGSDITDADAVSLSHETFETITDPELSAWVQALQGNEVADLCVGFENIVSLNGHAYTLQSEYSDIGHFCVSPKLIGPAATPQG